MAIDDLFQDSTDKVLNDRVERPMIEPVPQRSFGSNLWGVVPATGGGIAAGVAESGGFFSDILGAYGKIQAQQLAQSDPSNLFDPAAAEKARAASAPLRAEVMSGEAFSTETGTILRSVARDYAPDPQTANTAENLLFGLSRFVTKAVGYSLAAGPVPGAIMTGVDEGMTEADRLKAQGVDIETRTKVGVAAGVVAGGSVALPIAGGTFAKTAGLVAVGGPGGFIAQQAASKAILENAGYDKLAEQHDPFDPVGLAVSTLVPAGFGAYAMRGARLRPAAPADAAAARQLEQMGGNERTALNYADPRLDAYTVTAAQREGIPPEMLLAIKNAGERSNPKAVSPKGAKGVMQFMPETWAAYGKGDPRDPQASIDAGARYMKDLLKQYDGNVQAALAHYNGGSKAGKAVLAGEPAPFKETRAYLERTERFMAERQGTEAGRAAAADPEMVAAARVQQVRETVEASNLRDPADPAGAAEHLDAVLRASDQLAAGERVNIAETMPLDPATQARLLDSMAERMEATREELPPAGEAFDPDTLAPIQNELAAVVQLRQAMDEAAPAAVDVHAAKTFADAGAAAIYLREQRIGRTHRAEQTGRDTYSIKPKAGPKVDWRAKVAAREAKLADQLRVANENAAARSAQKAPDIAAKPAEPAPATEAGAPKAESAAPEQATGAPSAKQAANLMAASIEAQSAELARLAPDMMVQLEGMTTPMRLADALEAVKAEAAKDIEDAPLLQVAAECFLRSA